jgi:hypothetical protein
VRACIWLASVPVQYRNSHYVSVYSIRGGKNVWRLGVLGRVCGEYEYLAAGRRRQVDGRRKVM